MPLQIYVASRTDAKNKATSSPYPIKIQLESAQPTLGELKSQVANKISILKVERQRITKEDKKPLTNDELKLKDEGLKDGDTVWVKDLGPQVSRVDKKRIRKQRYRGGTKSKIAGKHFALLFLIVVLLE